MNQFDVPIVFLIFNRPETTIRVFEAIRSVRPRKLLVVADGPRLNHPGEAEKCAMVRSILEQVDWPCEVLQNYSETNLGCKKRVSSGLDWVFREVEEAIILEDDCLPHPTFFPFCKELLEKYREDERIAAISGDNFQFGLRISTNSYYFSRYTHIWGWATWRRAWRLYDVGLSRWPRVSEDESLYTFFQKKKVARFWERIFSDTYNGKIDTWDHQLTFAFVTNGCLCAVPDRNLVTNIGFGKDATHTKHESRLAGLPCEAMEFPLCHPAVVDRDIIADARTEDAQFSERGILNFIESKISRIFHAM